MNPSYPWVGAAQAPTMSPDPARLHAEYQAIMSAPLDANEKAIIERYNVDLAARHTSRTSTIIGAGAVSLLGIVTGSDHYIRNALVGALLGFGVGFGLESVFAVQMVGEVANIRNAKWVKRQAELLGQK